ncbi:MAG: alanine racemase, partial [Pseudomonadota bacterium]
MDLSALNTPFLVLDRDKVQSNERKMRHRVDALGVSFRPHVKTHKSIDVLRFLASMPSEQKITVSTLREARYFFENGVSDIMYGVAVTPQKLEDVADLIQRGAKLSIILDSPFMASEATRLGRELGVSFETFIEIDTDGHRSGIEPSDNDLLEIGEILSAGHGAELIGVMAHAGDSYDCADTAAITDHAELERAQTVLAAKRLRSAGFECHQVSVGSTPTATFARHLDSVTELRAGVYAFQDLFQAGLGVCSVEEIALSVMTTVIGHSKSKNRFIIDAGWMAMSR